MYRSNFKRKKITIETEIEDGSISKYLLIEANRCLQYRISILTWTRVFKGCLSTIEFITFLQKRSDFLKILNVSSLVGKITQQRVRVLILEKNTEYVRGSSEMSEGKSLSTERSAQANKET